MSLSRLSLDELLERVASSAPAPGAGPVAAWTGALAAALVEMVSEIELEKDPSDPPAVRRRRERARALRARLVELAELDVAAYTEVLAVLRRREEPGHGGRLRKALSDAAEPPMEIAALAAETVQLAAAAAADARGGVRGEAIAAAVVAEAAVRTIVPLVEINLAGMPDDPRRSRVTSLADDASARLTRANQSHRSGPGTKQS